MIFFNIIAMLACVPYEYYITMLNCNNVVTRISDD